MNTTVNMNANAKTFKMIRAFLPLLASIGWFIGFTIGHIKFFEIFSLALVGIGLVSALSVCPAKILLFPFKCIPFGFSTCRKLIPYYGVADLCAAIFGTCLGFFFGILVSFGCPAFFTIKKYLEEKNK